jgi:hypothetical protein
MKAIGYIRVSTEEQTNGVSLEAQEAKIRAWCTLHDAELVAIYRDEGISGYKGRDSRPGLDTALKQVCELKGPLVVYSLSRLPRNTRETMRAGRCWGLCRRSRTMGPRPCQREAPPRQAARRVRHLGPHAGQGRHVGIHPHRGRVPRQNLNVLAVLDFT